MVLLGAAGVAETTRMQMAYNQKRRSGRGEARGDGRVEGESERDTDSAAGVRGGARGTRWKKRHSRIAVKQGGSNKGLKGSVAGVGTRGVAFCATERQRKRVQQRGLKTKEERNCARETRGER